MTTTDPSTVNRDTSLLYPKFAAKVLKAVDRCHGNGLEINVFEAWRSPARQTCLYAQGRTSPGKVVTRAQAWESYHQLGLAVDLAFLRDGKWSWNGNWDKVTDIFLSEGLESLKPYEQAHMQMTKGLHVKVAVALMRECGLQRVWMEVGG